MFKFFSLALVSLMLVGCSDTSLDNRRNAQVQSDYFYYGDTINDAVLKINYKTMELESVIASSGVYPYEVANGFDNKLLVLDRNDTDIGVIVDNTVVGSYDLSFKPRSIALNITKKTILANSVSEPKMQILGSSTLYGDSTYTAPTSYGGSSASGHPIWINETYFMLLDRTENSIEIYKEGSSSPVSKLTTSSSVHHLIKKGSYYYGTLEGKRDGTSPGVIKFKISYGSAVDVTEKLISSYASLPSDFNATSWGFHHFAFHPDGQHIYVGSHEGNVFVIDKDTLALVDRFKAGIGPGHIKFYKDILIVTNHYDRFKSIYTASNPANNVFVKNIEFSALRVDNVTMQSHTSHVIGKYLYFTYNTDVESRFYKVDLETLEVADVITMTGRHCVMGALQRTIDQIDLGM